MQTETAISEFRGCSKVNRCMFFHISALQNSNATALQKIRTQRPYSLGTKTVNMIILQSDSSFSDASLYLCACMRRDSLLAQLHFARNFGEEVHYLRIVPSVNVFR